MSLNDPSNICCYLFVQLSNLQAGILSPLHTDLVNEMMNEVAHTEYHPHNVIAVRHSVRDFSTYATHIYPPYLHGMNLLVC